MPISYRVYDLALRSLRVLSPPFALSRSSKIGKGIRGRKLSAAALGDWAASERDRARPLAWFHAPSVGEGLQARAVMEELVRIEPRMQLLYTFFSPSAETLLPRMPADVGGYLPWDTRPEMGRLVDALRPELVVFTKTEVWPVLTTVARARGVPVALAAATLPPGAGRLKWPARRFLRSAFSSLSAVLAIASEDGERFGALGVPSGAIEVTGDPGIDSASSRVRQIDPHAPHLAPLRRNRPPTIVAGSTWPPDERVLFPALRAARERFHELRLIVAPHEPTGVRLASIERELEGTGCEVRRLADVEASGDAGAAPVILVDRVGVLAELYTVGDVAYVGGGFHGHGLHSVLEPAAAGVPMLFGPRHGNARAAAELAEAGGGRSVSGSASLGESLERWLGDPDSRAAAARAAFDYVERHRGAGARTAEALAALCRRAQDGAEGANWSSWSRA